jgi:hypothetical protein
MWALRQLQRERIIVEFTEMADELHRRGFAEAGRITSERLYEIRRAAGESVSGRGFWRAGEIFL